MNLLCGINPLIQLRSLSVYVAKSSKSLYDLISFCPKTVSMIIYTSSVDTKYGLSMLRN